MQQANSLLVADEHAYLVFNRENLFDAAAVAVDTKRAFEKFSQLSHHGGVDRIEEALVGVAALAEVEAQ